jgi:hypothetical protein
MPNLENAANALASQPTIHRWQGVPPLLLEGGDENCATLHNTCASKVTDVENEHDLGVTCGSLDLQGQSRAR